MYELPSLIATLSPFAIITSSAVPGTIPPGHGAFGTLEPQSPLPAVVIILATDKLLMHKIIKDNLNKVFKFFIINSNLIFDLIFSGSIFTEPHN
jgi:hypothetical protein